MTKLNDDLNAALEAEYDPDDGFLGLLRGGHFDTRARDRFLHLLESVEIAEDAKTIDRRLVALLWYMPLFMQWQGRRLDDEEQAALQPVLDAVTNRLERILGAP